MDLSMSAESVVREFCSAVRSKGPKELVGYFSEDAVYHNIPMEPVQGRSAIEATLGQFMSSEGGAEFEILALASAGNKVLTERIDRLTMAGKRIEIPVMGTFEVNAAGKISAWRDYFDLQQVMKQMG
jgi:limonene-1,2-epoxide hydrolase